MDWEPLTRFQPGPRPQVIDTLVWCDGPQVVLALDEHRRQAFGVCVGEQEGDDGFVERWLYAFVSPTSIISVFKGTIDFSSVFRTRELLLVDARPSDGEALRRWFVEPANVPGEYFPEPGPLFPDGVVDMSEEIAAQEVYLERRASGQIQVVFAGAPVVGSSGADAEFFSEAVGKFQALVAGHKATTSKRIGTTARRRARTYVTHTVPGSFGFALSDVPDEAQIPDEQFELRDVLTQVATFASGVQDSDADVVAEYLSTAPNPARKALADFFDFVHRSNASCRLSTISTSKEPLAVRWIDNDEARDVARTALEEAKREVAETVLGTFLGLMVHSRRFELRREDGVIVRGRVSREVDVEHANRLTNKAVQARLAAAEVVVHNNVRRSYVLESVTPLPPSEGSGA